jgi:23S rRNA pseudouridine2605 synthase
MSRNKTNTRTGLARALSKLGYCSRSTATKLIRSGQVCLNGCVVRDLERLVSVGADTILVDGDKVGPAKKIYLMMNKPRGVVTSARDDKGRDTVYSLLPEYRHWLAPVGRLDQASEGLLLFTNDSQWAARIAAPGTHLDKIYHVQIATVPEENLLHRLTAGVRNTEGDLLKAKRVTIVRHGKKNCWLEIVLDEGKNRHIRRMLSALGIEVLRLVRIAIGPLHLGDLPKRCVRKLTAQEKKDLDRAIAAHENLLGSL